MTQYHGFFEKSSLAKLKQIAKRRGESVAVVMREAVREFVERRG